MIELQFGQKLLCIVTRRQDVEQFPRCTARTVKSKTTGQQRTDWCAKITCYTQHVSEHKGQGFTLPKYLQDNTLNHITDLVVYQVN